MSRRQGAAVVATVSAIVTLVLGGVGLVVVESGARIEAVRAEIQTAAETQPGSEYYTDLMDTPGFLRRAVTESVVNDAVPRVDLVPRDGYVAITFGAFRGGNEMITLTRPWTPRFVTAPLAIGLVLAISGTLVAASRWRPRPAGSRRAAAALAPRGRPAGS